MSPAHMAAMKDEEALGAAMASLGLETAMKPLSAYIKSLEQRVKELEQKEAAAAEAALHQRSRAHEQDPSCTVFWTSRGYATPPWRWTSFSAAEANHPLRFASNWPTFLEILHDFEMPSFEPKYEMNFIPGNSYPYLKEFSQEWETLKKRLSQIVRERKGSFSSFYCSYDGRDHGAAVSILNDIMNLHADASLFDHLEQ